MEPRLKAGITTRLGGISKSPFDSMNMGLHVPDNPEDVLKNRMILSNILDVSLDNWVMGEQVHGTEINLISQDQIGRGSRSHQDTLAGIDGIITNQSGVLCTAFFADCVPLFFYDPETKWIGIAHAGWRGTVDQIAVKMVDRLIGVGVNKESLLAAIGPSISSSNYEVDAQVIAHVPEYMKDIAAKANKNGRYLLDLRQLNKEYLLQAGILDENISVTNYCTYTDEKLFYSHRRDQGKTGRMLGFIGFS
nr:peptidoglycan editing factor PgeF [Aquibacillus saliphilus]